MLTHNINIKRKGIIKQLAQRKPEPKVDGYLGMLCERFRHVMLALLTRYVSTSGTCCKALSYSSLCPIAAVEAAIADGFGDVLALHVLATG